MPARDVILLMWISTSMTAINISAAWIAGMRKSMMSWLHPINRFSFSKNLIFNQIFLDESLKS